MSKLNRCEQVEQVLTDALRCSNVGNIDLEQVSPPLDASVSRFGARPFYGPTPTAFGGCESNLGFDVLARLSDRVPDAAPSKSEGVLGRQLNG